MAEELNGPNVERVEIVLPTVETSESPTSDKKPLKLRFSPKAGKHLNPAVRLAVACCLLCFVVLLVYGIMSRSQKRR